MNPTTEYDHLMKQAFQILYPNGYAKNYFKAKPTDNCYHKAVKPDYVIPNRAWVDFKLHVSFRESNNVAWRPSALYSSLRKYLDHVSNTTNKLLIVYGKLHGSLNDVHFPIMRGNKTLISDIQQFKDKVRFVHSLKAISKLNGNENGWIIEKIRQLVC